MSDKLRILAVISNQRLLAKVGTIMHRRTLEVHHVTSGAGALVLGGNLGYELVIVESPLPDLEIRDLLAAMRALDSSSGQAGFLVLTADGKRPESLSGRTDLPIRLVAASADPVAIHDAISELLGVAARRSARLLVEVEIHLGSGPSRRLYQTQNLSESGVLLRGGRRLQPGSRVRFAIALAAGQEAGGEAIVVRQTSPPEPVSGTALRFLDLGQRQVELIRDFVYAGLTADEAPLPAIAEA